MFLENLTYIFLILLIVIYYLHCKKKATRRNLFVKKEELDAGLTEPPSLHPIIDHSKCLGCGSCVSACHEKDVLGIINRKSVLIAPTRCIGHGACKDACPSGAITLVFGTLKRGVDIPIVKPDFETNVPGLFIAGELGGMGLIRNAVEQGRQALESIKGRVIKDGKNSEVHDVLIIGAGPAGISSSLAAIEHKLKYVTLEQETFGGTVAHFPRNKIVMTQPALLPMFGKTKFTETTKEKLLEFWGDVAKRTNVEIKYNENVLNVERENGYFKVTSQNGKLNTYKSQTVLLAIGRRGTPRKLGVTGEDKPKVVYRLADSDQYKSQYVLVVGGGDSALEAAVTISKAHGTTVSLSYRSEAFGRAKKKNRDKVQKAQEEGQLKVYMKSNVKEISDDSLLLDHDGQEIELKNDAVIVCAGGILPTAFLKRIGVEVETKRGTE
ncbi:MAG: NAD(P)-binding domain-containing protein [Candidatus Brocadiaceae bacterium]|nr:NAD(P)-binding domain-containing protein [Candidatus Brocadiaceae bacterium]